MAAISSRYARAFAEVVFERKLDGQATVDQLQSLLAALHETPQLRIVWENPAIPPQQKRAVLDTLAKASGMSAFLRNFIAVLIDHHRIGSLEEVTRQVEHEINQHLGLAEAEITTARELREPEKRALESQLAGITGKTIKATYARNPEILGGALVKVGSTVYDGSVRGQLEKLKEELAAS